MTICGRPILSEFLSWYLDIGCMQCLKSTGINQILPELWLNQHVKWIKCQMSDESGIGKFGVQRAFRPDQTKISNLKATRRQQFPVIYHFCGWHINSQIYLALSFFLYFNSSKEKLQSLGNLRYYVKSKYLFQIRGIGIIACGFGPVPFAALIKNVETKLKSNMHRNNCDTTPYRSWWCVLHPARWCHQLWGQTPLQRTQHLRRSLKSVVVSW